MTTTLVDESGERWIRITQVRRTRANAPRTAARRTTAPIGRLIQIYGPSLPDYGDETMGASDLGPVVDIAITQGDKVLMVRTTKDDERRLTVEHEPETPADPWDTSLAGVYIVPKRTWDGADAAHVLGRIAGEIDTVNAWLGGEIYEAQLKTAAEHGADGPTAWTTADTGSGPCYGKSHALSGLYRSMGLPHSREAREKAGWRETADG